MSILPAAAAQNPHVNWLRSTAPRDRPQERLSRLGPEAASDTELLAMLLRSGTRHEDVLTLASRIISQAGSLAGLAAWGEKDFRSFKGVGQVKGLQLVAALELARRAVGIAAHEGPILNTVCLISEYMKPVLAGLEVEKFFALCLNRKNRLIRRVEIATGTATTTLAHPREVFRAAIRESAAAVVCVHNHPSGDPAPSVSDVKLTRLLDQASRAVEIDLLDHIILGRPGADPYGLGIFSFRQSGMM